MKKSFGNYCKNIARKASQSKVAVMTTTVLAAGSTFAEGGSFNPTTAATTAASTATGIAGIIAAAGITIVLGFLAVKLIRKA